MLRRVLLAFTLALPLAATAQHVPIKTVPVAEGAQFVLFPSQNRSMGGVSITLADPLHGPFVNPARGAKVTGMRVSSTPLSEP